MKLIISPAKKMNEQLDTLAPKQLPSLLSQTERLRNHLKTLPYFQLKSLLACNDQIARLNFQRFQTMDLHHRLTPAILSYEGIQYQYMAPQVFESHSFDYAEEHLRILSGFYGILRPFDGVVPYRLEMQAKLRTSFCSSLYQFWGNQLYHELTADGDHTIINLASAEYSRAVAPYLTPEDTFITCIFGELIQGTVKEKGVYVKMARGEMVRFLADHQITTSEDVKTFDHLGYSYQESLSTPETFVFLK